MTALTSAPFRGRIGRTLAESQPEWDARPDRTQAAPNVVTILLDDVGFAQLGAFGSSISTPRMNALADAGAVYANFHVAALCSPTRASLLTGRNHHAVGVGFLADFDTGYPGYRGAVTHAAAMLPEMLKERGYGTYAVGKWHLTPPAAMTPAGPFDQWPTGRGFERYYGFLWGEDDQYAPELWEDQHLAALPEREDYHLTEDLVDRASAYISDHISSRPDDPFYLHLALGACHAPHQAPPEYIERYRGAFDHGWDIERERVLARQIELGIVPEGTQLAPANDGIAAWADLDADRRRLYARMQEVFAGFMEHTDTQIGRLVDFLAHYSLLENTVIVLMSDNGASGEGGTDGSANEYRYFLGVEDTFEENLAMIDDLGSPATHNHYPSGWAQAGNTPLKRFKKHTFGGGVRAPLVIHWPGQIEATAQVRRQFHHVVDIVPTILEITGTEAPAVYRGIEQLPIDGTSMAYTFQSPQAPSARARQYFETAGYRGLYEDGYKLVTDHTPGTDFDEDAWELYRIEDDYSETRNLAAEEPEHVQRMIATWWEEAERNGVLPLDDRMQTRVTSRNETLERDRYRMLPFTRMPNGAAGPGFGGREFVLTVNLRECAGDESGVLVAYGRRASGFALFMDAGELVYDMNIAGRHTVVRAGSVPAGTRSITLALEDAGEGGVRAVLGADGQTLTEAPVPSLMPAGLGCLSVQVGYNAPSVVSPLYTRPARYTGTIDDITIDFPDSGTPLTEAAWQAALAQQ